MTIHAIPFLVALLLLWFPRAWMRRGASIGRRRRRGRRPAVVTPAETRSLGDERIRFGAECKKLRNYIDLLRGAAGSLAFSGDPGLPAAIVVGADAPRATVGLALGLGWAVLLLGLLAQTTRFEHRRLTFYPPIFYLAGVTFGLCDYRAALFSFALMWAINPGLGNAQAFLLLYAVVLVVFGFLFGGLFSLPVIFAGFLCFLPALLSLLANRPLIIMTRKGHRAATS